MATRQYIGARYIPIFADPVQWDSDNSYEYLTMVQNSGETYMSKQAVPIGAPLPDISDGEESNEFWVHMSNWNAQVETYRQEVLQYNGRITTLENDLPLSAFDSTHTVDDRFDTIEANSWVTTSRINDSAVTTAKIDDAAITTAKVDDAAITTAKINDAAITTAKVNDAAITTAKIDDGAVTVSKIDSSYVNSVNSKIEKLRFITAKDFHTVGRFLIGSSYHNTAPYYGYGASQGSAVVTIGNKDYWVCATNPDNNNHVIIVDLSNNTVLSDTQLRLGHANGASYDGEHTVMFANHLDNTIVYVDVSNVLTPYISQVVNTPNQESIVCACYIGKTGKVGLVHGQLSGNNFNITGMSIYADYTLTTLDTNINFDSRFNSNMFGGWQSVTCDGEHIYVCMSAPECVYIFNMDGSLYYIFNAPLTIEHIQADELECFFIYNNKIYMSALETLGFSLEPDRTDGDTLNMSTLFMTDIDTGNISIIPNGGEQWTVGILYDPFTTFTNNPTLFNKRLLAPALNGYLFIDDIFTMAINQQGNTTPVIRLGENYSVHTKIYNRNFAIQYMGYSIAAFWLEEAEYVNIGAATISGIFPRGDALKYGIIAVNSIFKASAAHTFTGTSLTHEVQFNNCIVSGTKINDYLNYNGSNLGSAYA